MKHAIALTGGIATGKSTVATLLKLHGYEVIDADALSHEILQQQASEIIRMFGPEYVEEGIVNRKKLGQLVFSHPEELKRLEGLLHPLIREAIMRRAALSEEQGVPYFVDIPLFFETRAYAIDKVLVVYAPRTLQIERAVKRDGMSEEDVLRRINAQMDIEEKRKMADYVIDNSRDIAHLSQEVETFRRTITTKEV